MQIKNMKNLIFRNFALASPGQRISPDQDAKQEMEILFCEWGWVENQEIDGRIMKEISSAVQRRAYKFWKASGWRKVKSLSESSHKKVSLWRNKNLSLDEARM